MIFHEEEAGVRRSNDRSRSRLQFPYEMKWEYGFQEGKTN